MSSEELYIMQETEDEWVQPTPASVAIGDAVTRETDLERKDLESLDTYVDSSALREVLDADGDDTLTIRIEGHDVTVHTNGTIDVGD